MGKKIMIIGTGWEQLPLLKKVKSMGYQTVVTTGWDKSKIEAGSKYSADPRDLAKLEQIFETEKPEAVLADECDYSMYAVSYLHEKYNLPGPDLGTLTITNNKYLQRELAGRAGVKQPRYVLCWSCEMAAEAARNIGYPVIIKPLDNRGSIGITTVQKESELKEAWLLGVSNSHSRLCLVEKFINGDVITVEGFHDSKKFNLLAVSTKTHYPQTPNVAKILYYPGLIDDEAMQRGIRDSVLKLVDTIKIGYGYCHIEFLIEKGSGDLYFIEIANRGGGVHISNLILPHITGIDLTEKLINMSLGKHVDIDWNEKYISKALMYFVNPKGNKHPYQIRRKYGNELLAMYMKSTKLLKNIKGYGAMGRAGVLILKGSSFEDMIAKADMIETEIGYTNKEFYWGNY